MAAEVGRLGGVPTTREGLLSLPGVGPYAANATLAVAFAQRAPVVDGVTARVYRRYFGLASSGPAVSDAGLWALVDDVTPSRGARTWNWSVLDLAATVCVAQRPRCGDCPLAATCTWATG